jgi:prophage antirepressor-like protein
MKTVELTVNESLVVHVIPNQEHEFLMPTKDVAKGYDISTNTLRSHLHRNGDELVLDKHFVKGVSNSNTLKNIQPHQVFWTKAGIIRLGMFIRSERAKLFRDWAEQVILEHLSSTPVSKTLPPAPKRKHNRLTQERLLSIMQDICMIEDSDLRIRLSNKLLN